jgi:drug/metabolite transporter (DMT)-like permease
VVWFSTSATPVITSYGVMLALLSGAVTSAMGYALWYWILPQISTSIASVSQLVVPVLAMAAGVLLLGELVTVKFILACGLVLGGIAISLGLHRSLRLT